MSRRPTLIMPGKIAGWSTDHALIEAFRSIGWGVQDINLNAFLGASVGGMKGKIGYRMHLPAALFAFRAAVIAECRKTRPDWLLVIKGPGLDVPTLQAVRAMGIRTCNYYPDVNFDHAMFDKATLAEYDLLTSTKTFHIPWFREHYPDARAAFVRKGFSPTVHRPVWDPMLEHAYRCDVLYGGTRSDYKQEMLEGLVARLPGLDLRIFGNNWEQTPRSSPLWRHFDLGPRVNCPYAEAIQTARINLSFHYGPDTRGWADHVSARTFEIPACGGFMLHIDNPEVREAFEPGRECAVFGDIDDMAAKIRHYLDNPDERRAIADAGRARAARDHSYVERAKELAGLMLG